jgi:tetratricopeptide (TPR) repeat protein
VEADRALVAYRRGDAEQASAFGRSALASARAAADPGATAQALNVLGMLAARAGDTAAAESYLRDSLAEARRAPGRASSRPEGAGQQPGEAGQRTGEAGQRTGEAGQRTGEAGQRTGGAGQRTEGAGQAVALPLGAAVAALNNLARLLAETGRREEALAVAAEALELGSELGDQHRVAALHTNMADLLHASGQGEDAMAHLKEAARRFASVDVGDAPRPEIWTLVEW